MGVIFCRKVKSLGCILFSCIDLTLHIKMHIKLDKVTFLYKSICTVAKGRKIRYRLKMVESFVNALGHSPEHFS